MSTPVITIEKLIYGGDGLGRMPDGAVVFIPNTCPEDTVSTTLPEKRHGALRADITGIVAASPNRIDPTCSVFGTCGGCQWQHINLGTQRHWKQQIVAESLSRIGKLHDVTVNPIIPGDDSGGLGYRNKVTWYPMQTAHGWVLGYKSSDEGQVIPFETCAIMPAPWNDIYRFFAEEQAILSQVEAVQLQGNQAGQVYVSLFLETEDDDALETGVNKLLETFPNVVGAASLLDGVPLEQWGQERFTQTLLGVSFETLPTSFFQTNLEVASAMASYIAAQLPAKFETFLDLYAGVGLFSVLYGDRAGHITAIESNPDSCTLLKKNALAKGLTGILVLTGDVEPELHTLDGDFEVAVIDPPRAGCSDAIMTWLAEHVSGQIVYVSCNPTTLARDLKRLSELGWAIESVQPFDMFPQTYHVETVVVLR